LSFYGLAADPMAPHRRYPSEHRERASARINLVLQGEFKRIEAIGHAHRIGAAAYNGNVDPRGVRTSAKGELEPASGDACVDMGRPAATSA
jgi:hypothetical protein